MNMNMPKRIVTLLATSLIAVAIAPSGVQARASNPTRQVVLQPPYDDAKASSHQFCGSFSGNEPVGDAKCYDLASSADVETGGLTGRARTSTETPLDSTGLLGKGKALANSSAILRYEIPLRGPASTVTFTVSTKIKADASASGINVCGFAFLFVRAWARGAFSQGVEDERILTSRCDTGTAMTVEDRTFSLELSPADRMTRSVNLEVLLIAGAQIGFPELEGSGMATGNAEVIVESVIVDIDR